MYILIDVFNKKGYKVTDLKSIAKLSGRSVDRLEHLFDKEGSFLMLTGFIIVKDSIDVKSTRGGVRGCTKVTKDETKEVDEDVDWSDISLPTI